MSLRAFFRRPAVVLVLGLCGVGLVVSILGRLASGPANAPKRVELASGAGSEACPAFSPDGQRLAYSARGTAADDVFHLFVRAVPSGPAQQLTHGEVGDIGPVWSPDGGSLAFLRASEGRARVMLVPAGGGAERQIGEFETSEEDDARPAGSLAWTHDGKSLVVVQAVEDQPSHLGLMAVSDGTIRRLTNPPAKTPGDSSPAVSPDGRSLAFARGGEEQGADIWICDLSGANLRRVTFDGRPIRGIAWTPDSQELVYAADRAGGWRLWRTAAYGGSPREVLVGGKDTGSPSISPKGHRLVFAQTPTVAAIWRADLTSSHPAASAAPLIRSSAGQYRPAWSPDGKRIADVSDQTGEDEIWVGDANWSNPQQLTNLKARRVGTPHWSPDGRKILFVAWTERGPEVYTVPADGSAGPTHLRLPGIGGQSVSWSRDGKSIYFTSEGMIWKAAADGSNPRQITQRRGSGDPQEAVDGKSLYYRNRRSIWRVAVNGGEEQETIVPDHDLWWTTIQPVAKGIYYLEFNRGVRAQVVVFYDFKTQKSSEVLRLKDADISPDSTFSISPDGKYILYPKVDRSATNLVMVEDYR